MPLITKVLRPPDMTAQNIAFKLYQQLSARGADPGEAWESTTLAYKMELVDIAQGILDGLVAEGVLGE